MFHIVKLGKNEAEKLFKSYTDELLTEFIKEIAVTRMQVLHPNLIIPKATTSHQVVPDNGGTI